MDRREGGERKCTFERTGAAPSCVGPGLWASVTHCSVLAYIPADRAGMYGYLLPIVTSLPALGFGLPNGSRVFRIFTPHSFLNYMGLAWPIWNAMSLCLDTSGG